MIEESVIEWWNRAHKTNHPVWLSGTSGEETWHCLGVRNLLSSGVCVLEIGVGLGNSIRALAGMGCKVSALDISPIALDRVSSFARCYLPNQQLPRDVFDVAMSHLVVQHMADEDLMAQMKAVLVSLKPTGVFALQFATDTENPNRDYPFDELLARQKGGGVCRSPEKMKRMALEAGAKVVKLMEAGIFPDFGSRWYVIHLVRSEL